MAKTKAEREAEVMQRALLGFDQIQSIQQEIRQQCLQDRRFVYVPSAQWENGLAQQFEGRPRFEVNKVQKSCIRIFSEYRNNRITVDYRPKDDDASSETAETLNGMFRADEQESNAQEAYDTAFDEGVAGGMGALRLRNDYVDEFDEDSDEQHICIDPIPDADVSVFYDANAKRQDKKDAIQCWVLQCWTPPTYELEWGINSITMQGVLANAGENKGATQGIVSLNPQLHLTQFDWFQADAIYVAEYYEVELKRTKVQTWQHQVEGTPPIKLRGEQITEDSATELEAQGYYLAREKTTKERRVHKYIIDGVRILEDCGLIAGPNIPVVPFYGKRLFVDSVERFQGHIRLAIDPQRLYNMVVSMVAAIAATSPQRKPIFAPEQVKGLENVWATSSLENRPYELANPLKNNDGTIAAVGPLAYLEPPTIPEALAGLIQLLGADLQDVLGAQQATEQVVSNIAHKTVELIQNNLDMNSFIYMDNFAKTMRRVGEVYLGMAKEVYVEDGRKVRTINAEDQEGQATLNQPQQDAQGVTSTVNDFGSGQYAVWVDVGPSFSNKRDAAIRTLVSLLQYTTDPTDQAAIVGTIVKMTDGEGLSSISDYFRKKLVGMGVEDPTDDEKAQMAQAKEDQANQPPSANDQFLLASAAEAGAKAKQASANTIKTLADAENVQATTSKTIADTAQSQAKTLQIEATTPLNPQLTEIMQVLQIIQQHQALQAAAQPQAPAEAAPAEPVVNAQPVQ